MSAKLEYFPTTMCSTLAVPKWNIESLYYNNILSFKFIVELT